MSSDGRLLQALLRNDFRAFVEKVFMTLTPGQTFIRSWHLEAIAYQLERVRRSEIKRLIINMPPRSLKSIMASVAFPAFILGLDPTRRIICASYSGELAKKHSNDFCAVLDSRWYRSTFPGTRVGPFKNNETEIELTARGFRLATSVGGTLTGRGGDIIIVDETPTLAALGKTSALGSDTKIFRDPALDQSRLKKHFWFDRPVWLWTEIERLRLTREIKDPWHNVNDRFVFCEDISAFKLRSASRSFQSDLISPYRTRFVSRVDSIEYQPAHRLALS
jgi:hypothetical protein